MTTEIEKAIKFLAGKITGEIKPTDAMNYAQAALNLAHTEATLQGSKK